MKALKSQFLLNYSKQLIQALILNFNFISVLFYLIILFAGFIHEHNRPDRDDFLAVDVDNILDEKQSNYIKRNYTPTEFFYDEYPTDVDTGLTPFDVFSVLIRAR